MKISTADGPMLVNVANQMRCKQGTGSFSSGTTSLAATPCSVAVTGSKDGQYYEGEDDGQATSHQTHPLHRLLLDIGPKARPNHAKTIITTSCPHRSEQHKQHKKNKQHKHAPPVRLPGAGQTGSFYPAYPILFYPGSSP